MPTQTTPDFYTFAVNHINDLINETGEQVDREEAIDMLTGELQDLYDAQLFEYMRNPKEDMIEEFKRVAEEVWSDCVNRFKL